MPLISALLPAFTVAFATFVYVPAAAFLPRTCDWEFIFTLPLAVKLTTPFCDLTVPADEPLPILTIILFFS